MGNKNSVCYLCPDDTGLSCRNRAAEVLRNDDNRRQRIVAQAAEYDSSRGTNGLTHERKI